MRTFWPLFTRIYLGTQLPYLLGMVGFSILLSGSIITGVIFAVVGSFLMSLIVSLGRTGRLWVALDQEALLPGDDPLDPQAIRTVEVELPPEHAFELCVASLSQCTPYEVLEQDKQALGLRAIVSRTFGSAGQNVRFELAPLPKGRTRVTVHSWLRYKLYLVDGGKNLENVVKISDFLVHPDSFKPELLGKWRDVP